MPITRILTFISAFLIILTILMSSCSNKTTSKTQEKQEETVETTAGPPVIIYKTKMDFSKNVPVTLSEDKSKITSYPGRNDIKYGKSFAYPTELNKGFLLDNRGIDEHVAFLDYTYEEFSKLQKNPTADELMGHIMEYDPLLEMYRCGTRYDYKNLIDELNDKITVGKFNDCVKLK